MTSLRTNKSTMQALGTSRRSKVDIESLKPPLPVPKQISDCMGDTGNALDALELTIA